MNFGDRVATGSPASETSPIVTKDIVGPTRESHIAKTGHILTALFVGRKREVLPVINGHFEALVVDNCPVAWIN